MNTQTLTEWIGNPRGAIKRKENRAIRLIRMWSKLEAKLIRIIERGGGVSETAICGYAVLLMMETGIRIGNESSAEGWICDNQIICRKDNPAKGLKIGDVIWKHPEFGNHVKTYGLTTLLHSHVKKKGKKLEVSFVGKKLVDQNLVTRHPTLIQFKPTGQPDDLFLGIDYYTLKKFIKKYVGSKYTPKDLRTAKVNLIFVDKFGAAKIQKEFSLATTKSGRKKVLGTAIEEVAGIIGHTKGVCKSAYLSAPLISTILNTSTTGYQI